jgi:hypothetical protein
LERFAKCPGKPARNFDNSFFRQESPLGGAIGIGRGIGSVAREKNVRHGSWFFLGREWSEILKSTRMEKTIMTIRKFSSIILTAWLFVAFLCGTASGTILIENQQTDFLGVGNRNQPLAKVVVGAADVPITGFGVFGQAQVAGNLKWIIFDSTQLTSPVYLSPAMGISGDPGAFSEQAKWHDSPAIDFTLLAGHSYAIGVISDQIGANGFRWGASPDNTSGPYPSVTASGLDLPFMESLVNSGVQSGVFSSTPNLLQLNYTTRRQISLRIEGPGDATVPEPGSVVIWACLAAVGLVLGWRRVRD